MKATLIPRKMAFTMVECMLVIALIGFLTTISVPAWMKARASAWKSACLNSQVQLRDVISRYSLSEGRGEHDPLTIVDKSCILKMLKPDQMPCCPIRITPFNWPGTFGGEIVCPVSASDHILPDSPEPSNGGQW